MSASGSGSGSAKSARSGTLEVSDRGPITDRNFEGRELEVPTHRCYWALLPVDLPLASTVWSGQDGAAAFEEEFQAIIPVDLASLHVTYVPAGTTAVLACGVDHTLAQYASRRGLSLAPEAIPAELGKFPQPAELELLGGDCEPRMIARARTRLVGTIAASIALTGVVVALGLERRGSHWESVASAADNQRITALRGFWQDKDPVTAARQLTLELDEARLIHGTQPADTRDAAASAAEVLGAMNALTGIDTEVVSCTESTVVVTLSAPDERSTSIEQIGAPTGWSLAEPRLLATPRGTQFTLQFARKRGVLP